MQAGICFLCQRAFVINNLQMVKTTFFLVLLNFTYNGFSQNPLTIVNDDFGKNPFEMVLSVKDIHQVVAGEIRSEKKAIENTYTGGIDTLISFKSNAGDITFYKTPKKIFFYSAVILNKGIKLAKGVEIDQSKKRFLKSFGVENFKKIDLFIITDNRHYSKHKFFFRNNRLIKIELNAGVD